MVEEEGRTSLESQAVENGDAPFPAGREAVRMFLRGSFPCVFFLAINLDRPEQYAELLRNLQAVYRRFCQEQGRARAFCANSALYAKPANALSSKVFSEVVDLASGDVVQLVRMLPCHRPLFLPKRSANASWSSNRLTVGQADRRRLSYVCGAVVCLRWA
jgi:hypothetical protein